MEPGWEPRGHWSGCGFGGSTCPSAAGASYRRAQQLNTELETGFLFSAPLCCPLTGDECWKVDSDQAALGANLGGPRMNLCFDPDYGLTLVENVTNAIRP